MDNQEKNQILTTGNNTNIKKQKPKTWSSVVNFIIREIVSVLFWLYTISKIFVFDFDIFIINKYISNYAWLIKFKFFILIGVIATVWLLTKNKKILPWVLYVLLYPFILIFWRIPFFIFKQKSWILVFAVVNSVISLFRSIKYKFITSTVFLICTAIIFGFSNIVALWVAIITLLLLLFVIYINSLFVVIKPSSVFQVHKKLFPEIRKRGKNFFTLDETVKNITVENMDKGQLEKWTTTLQSSVLFNRVCLFSAKKLKDYQNSGLGVLSYVFSILSLIILTVFSFAVINYGIYKIDNSYFEFFKIPSFFTFVYFSFGNLVFNTIKELSPSMPISQALSMIESFFALFIGAILVSLFFSFKSQRYANELNEVIKSIEDQGSSMEGYIKDEYKFNNIYDAISELEKLKSGLVSFIYKITESLK
jgi:hypothetical protein